jgi:PAS domain S-box-containing protein
MALDTNAEHDRIYGITPYATKWSLMSFLDKVIPEDRPTIESYIHDNIADAADGQFECRIRRADGSIRWLSIIGKFQFDRNDQATHILGVTQDITRQKKLEIQNRDINTQLNFTLDKCHIGAWSMDLSSKKIHGTQEHSRLFGYPERHPVWDFELFLHHIIPEDRSFVKEFALNVINRPDKWEKEYRIRRTDGEVRWIRDIGDVELDQDGKPVRLLGLLMDITETKQASLESHTLQQQLQHAQKMELLGQLAGGIAHDFNNILAVILGNAQMALRLVHDDSPLLKYLNTIEHSVTRSAEMVRQMLAFARKQQSNPQNILLDYELNNIQLILRKLIEENIELRFQLDSPNQCVNLDPSALLQIISNLVINSRDAISGTGVITIRTALLRSNECDGYVVTAPEFDGYHIRISVSDTGCGIDSQTLPHIFEPFFTTKPVGRGTGLGLSMAYGLVKQNNGLISCHSELGEGTTFNICFPLANTRDKMQEISTRNSPQPNVNGTILLIEDEPSILSIIKSTLEEHGFRVQTAPNAEKGVEVIRSHKEINIVISDIILPGMNGIQMSKEILKLKPDTKFIFMSGYSSGIFGDQGESEIGTNFISKPFSINDLLTLIAKVCPLDPDPGKELPHT